MRVLLITPFSRLTSTHWMPLGVIFMAARLRQGGHTASVFDRFAVQSQTGRNADAVDAAMLAEVARFQPDWIGLSTVSPAIHDTVHCASLIREAGFRGPLWAGGYHATALPELTLRKIPGLDGVVAGEGEEVLAQLADGMDPAGLPGVWRRDGAAIVAPRVAQAQVAKLDDLPLPAFDLLDMPLYTERNPVTVRGHLLRAATLITSRGCAFRCRFCAESLTYGRGIRYHSAEYVLEWVRKLAADYPIDGLHFHDNDFLADEGRARAVCAGLQKSGLHRKLRWGIQARADRLTPEMAGLLHASGCVLVEIGVEAGTQEELDFLRKGTTPDINFQAVRVCRRAGLDVHAYMLQRTEDETIPDLERRLDWLKRADPTSFQWSPLYLFPGTPLYAEKGGDFFARNPWTEEAVAGFYAADHLSRLPAATRDAWMKKEFGPFARWHWWRHAIGRYPVGWLFARSRSRWIQRLKRWFSGMSVKNSQ